MHRLAAVLLLSSAALIVPGRAQDRPAPARSVYRVDLVFRDSADTAGRPRRYSVMMDTEGRGSIRVGNRVPYVTGTFQPGTAAGGASPLVSTQYQYADIGVNVDCSVKDVAGKAALNTQIEVSSLVQPTKPAEANVPPAPTVAQTRIGVATLLDVGKSTSIASFDDPVTGRRFDVEATVKKMD